jgi:L-threonylcarbamoyladenylate synthase
MISKADILSAAECLRNGGTVVFPTETVYGLGANALDSTAVAKVYKIKCRPVDHPLIVHVLSLEEARGLVHHVSPVAETLAKQFWPGPLTLLFKKNEKIGDFVTGGQDTVALRVPKHRVARELLEAAGVPVAAPSANLFGKVSATAGTHLADLAGKVDFILEGEVCDVGVESTIIDVSGPRPVLLRPGGVTREAIEACIGEITAVTTGHAVKAPGTLSRHYAPQTALLLKTDLTDLPRGRLGLLCLKTPKGTRGFHDVIALSEQGDLQIAAAQLFAAIRHLDRQSLDVIVALKFPEEGLGVAINDRLTRAAARY